MKKLLLSGSIAILLLPGLAFAAFNDVSLTTNTVLSVNGITVNVSGETATIESIVVGSTNFIVTIESGSKFQVTAPDRNILGKDSEVGLTSDTICNDTKSVLGYSTLAGSSELVVTITPSSTLCASPTTTTTTASSRSDGKNRSIALVTTPVVTPVPIVQTANAEAIAAIKTQLVVLIQELITLLSQELVVLLNQEIQAMQTSGKY